MMKMTKTQIEQTQNPLELKLQHFLVERLEECVKNEDIERLKTLCTDSFFAYETFGENLRKSGIFTKGKDIGFGHHISLMPIIFYNINDATEGTKTKKECLISISEVLDIIFLQELPYIFLDLKETATKNNREYNQMLKEFLSYFKD